MFNELCEMFEKMLDDKAVTPEPVKAETVKISSMDDLANALGIKLK